MFIESLWFYIVLVIIIGFISFKISAPLIRRWNEFGIKIADQIDKKTNCCYSVLVIEVISILTVIIPIMFLYQYLNFLKNPLYIVLIFLLQLEFNIRNNLLLKDPQMFSLFYTLNEKLKKKWEHFYYRFVLVIGEFYGIIVITSLFYLFLTFVAIAPKKEYIYLIFLFTPCALAFWVYFNSNFRFQDESTMKARKFITYLILILISLSDGYSKISNQILESGPLFSKEIDLLLAFTVLIYIPLDRLLNLWRDDYFKFKDTKKK